VRGLFQMEPVPGESRHTSFVISAKTRNVFFTLLGVIGLLLRGRYSGPYQEIVRSYGGNISVSFAVYFIVTNLPLGPKFRKLVTAGLALAAVDLFEATDGFKVMSNTYDPADYLANTLGVVLALLVDALASRIIGRG